jgi:hypothetical protein
VSDPTYRIEIEHLPGEVYPFYARVYLLSDDGGYPAHTQHGDTADEVEALCREWIRKQHVKQTTRFVYVDDDGQPVEAHSVKA